MADAVCVAEDRDAGVGLHELDELVGAARDDEVYVLVEGEEFVGFFAGGEELDGVGICACVGDALADGFDEGGAGSDGFFAAFEDDTVAGFDGEGGDLHDCVGARLEDDAEYAEGAINVRAFDNNVVQVLSSHSTKAPKAAKSSKASKAPKGK